MPASFSLMALAGGGGALEPTAASVAPAAVNLFGALFLALTWAVLVGLNLWCLGRLLRPRKRPDRAS